MELLVQKPQFDSLALQPGKAVHIKDVANLLPGYDNSLTYDTGLKNIDVDALVTKVHPLSIRVVYFDTKKNEEKGVTIPVELVADKKIRIEIMGVVQCKAV